MSDERSKATKPRKLRYIIIVGVVIVAIVGALIHRKNTQAAQLKNQKTVMVEELQTLIEEDEVTSDKVIEILDANGFTQDWYEDVELAESVGSTIFHAFLSNEDACNCFIEVFDQLEYAPEELKTEFERELNSEINDIDTAIIMAGKLDELALNWGKTIYIEVSKEDWESYDTSTMTIDDVDELNWGARRHFLNEADGSEIEKRRITQENVDNSKIGKTFEELMGIVGELERRGYTSLRVISMTDVEQFLEERGKPVHLKEGEGGYYDNNTIKEYHFDKTQSQEDVITYDGKTGFANTVNVAYSGDFASHTFSLEYVDYDDYYKTKTIKVWKVYFMGRRLSVSPETFQEYSDFIYASPYLFAYGKSSTDVYDEEGHLALQIIN